MTASSGPSHLTSCLSSAELISCLFFNEMKYDIKQADNPDNDEFILSKSHASSIYYSALARAGCIKEDFLKSRKSDPSSENNLIPNTPWIKFPLGFLGQGLSVGLGMALASKLQKRHFRVFVLLGDSEISEGSVYEAAQLASHYHLNNLYAIIDINRLGQTGETLLGKNIKAYKSRFESLGWHTICIDGHDIKQILSAFQEAKKSTKPIAILAQTIKGKGVSFLEDKEEWHGKSLSPELMSQALKEIPEIKFPGFANPKPKKVSVREQKPLDIVQIPSYKVTELVSTSQAYGISIAKRSNAQPHLLALDSESSNLTCSEKIKQVSPTQYIESYCAEQNMICMSIGLAIKGFLPFASSLGAFLTKAHDSLRAASLSKAHVVVCGSHAGASAEENISHMALEDISLFRSLPNSTIIYPSDAVSTEKLVQKSENLTGITYIRTTKPATPILYNSHEDFPIGDFKIVSESKNDQIVLIGSGITLHESLKAKLILKNRNISAAVIDLYCIKPLNIRKLIAFIKEHGDKVVISEDHYSSGGIGEMLSYEFSNSNIQISHLSINEISHYKIDSQTIADAAFSLLNPPVSLENLVEEDETLPKKIKKNNKSKNSNKKKKSFRKRR